MVTVGKERGGGNLKATMQKYFHGLATLKSEKGVYFNIYVILILT